MGCFSSRFTVSSEEYTFRSVPQSEGESRVNGTYPLGTSPSMRLIGSERICKRSRTVGNMIDAELFVVFSSQNGRGEHKQY